MMQFLNGLSFNAKRNLFLVLGVLLTILIAWLVYVFGIITPLVIIVLSGFVLLQILYFNNPRSTLYILIAYCFLYGIFAREIGGLPYGTLIEVFIGFSYIVALIKIPVKEWKVVQNDLFYLLLIWFTISVLEVINPAGASVMGWLQEIRSAAMYPLLIIPITYIFFNTNKDLNNFLKLILALSLLASLNGIKQLYIGPSAGEQRFLDEGGAITHLLFGQLRVFSFYSEAGQFGASQAHLCLVSFILALGPFKWWKRAILLIASGFMFYGMLISGTRGALFALIVGVFLAIALSKKFKVMIIGGFVALCCLGVLKYTHIGSGSYQVNRLRSALDPQDASLNVRIQSQKVLKEYMSGLPFGGGLGVIGAWGTKYNQDKFLSTVQPDSYWVKVWAMYGIVGFTIWFGIMMYILGKCCGIVWKLKDPGLRIKAIALTAGFAGILFCSYGNEVINTMPSSIIVYVSWVFVFICPKLEKELLKKDDELLNQGTELTKIA